MSVSIDSFEAYSDKVNHYHELLIQQLYEGYGGHKKERNLYVAEAASFLEIMPNTLHNFLKAERYQGGGDFPIEYDDKGRIVIPLNVFDNIRSTYQNGKHKPLRPKSAFKIAFTHLKGGSAKTTSSVSFAQYAALMGYRVLLVDSDPQASSTLTLGKIPEIDVSIDDTISPFIYGDEPDLRYAVTKTYWHNLDLIPSKLEVFDIENYLPAMQKHYPTKFRYWERISTGLEPLLQDYDIVVFDCAPSFSYQTTNVLYSADGLIIPTPAEFLDYSATASLLTQIHSVFGYLKKAGLSDKSYEFFKIMITKYRNVDSQNAVIQVIRKIYDDALMTNSMLFSDAIGKSGVRLKTPYELSPYDINRSTYTRAIESANAVNDEILKYIKLVWQNQKD